MIIMKQKTVDQAIKEACIEFAFEMTGKRHNGLAIQLHFYKNPSNIICRCKPDADIDNIEKYYNALGYSTDSIAYLNE